MKQNTRLEILLPVANKRVLLALADETGISVSDLVRIGVRWVMANHKSLLRPPMEDPR